MKTLKFITGLLLLSFISFGESSNSLATKINSTTEHSQVEYILFGVFCGQCSGHCATMYKYNMIGNSNTLFVDTTDSYFKNFGKVVCKTQIIDIKKFQLINKLVREIPSRLLTLKENKKTFGCPDCTDGCGIYFEFRQEAITKKVYLDYHTEELPKDIKYFSELIKTTLIGIKKK